LASAKRAPARDQPSGLGLLGPGFATDTSVAGLPQHPADQTIDISAGRCGPVLGERVQNNTALSR